MDLLTTARSPWGESVFLHISWSLFWASLVGGLLFEAGRREHLVADGFPGRQGVDQETTVGVRSEH